MFKIKSIFVRYFIMTTAILLICIATLGFVVTSVFSNYWLNEKRDMITENAVSIADLMVEGNYIYPVIHGSGQVRYALDRSIGAALALSANATDADIYITNYNGYTELCSEGVNCQHTDQVIPQDILQQINECESGETYYEVGTLGGIFNQAHYTAATPVILNDNIIVTVVVSAPAKSFTQMNVSIRNIIIWSSLGVILLSFIITYLVTYQMVKPLRQMAFAAHRFGEGDFSYKVNIKGNDELAALGNAFNSMALSLEAAESMRRSFVANVSHELKTPMTVIAGYIDGILDGTIPKDKHDYYLKTVSDEVKRLSRLVRTMLDLSRLEAGEMKMNPSQFDINEKVFRILLSFERRIEEKNIEICGLENNTATFVNADSDMIHQVIYNLMDNAVKFVDEGGYISINIWEVSGRVYCSIRNSGVGIAESELPNIFDRFYKTDKSRSLDKNGVGLGLYLVSMFIKSHKGEIYVSSVENEYTCFEFWLPKEFMGKSNISVNNDRANQSDDFKKYD